LLEKPDDIVDYSQDVYWDYFNGEHSDEPYKEEFRDSWRQSRNRDMHFIEMVIPEYPDAWSEAYRWAVDHVEENYPDPEELPGVTRSDAPPEVYYEESLEKTYQRFAFAWTQSRFLQTATMSVFDWCVTVRTFEALLYPWLYSLPHEIGEQVYDFVYDLRRIQDDVYEGIPAEVEYKTATWYPSDDLQKSELMEAIDNAKERSSIYTSGPHEHDDGSVELSMMYRYK
jgi:hypothetical protein